MSNQYDPDAEYRIVRVVEKDIGNGGSYSRFNIEKKHYIFGKYYHSWVCVQGGFGEQIFAEHFLQSELERSQRIRRMGQNEQGRRVVVACVNPQSSTSLLPPPPICPVSRKIRIPNDK